MKRSESLLFEKSQSAAVFPCPDLDEVVQAAPCAIDRRFRREHIHGFPNLNEVEVVRHFHRLARMNYCVEDGLYPLGSCTMKYNPKINDTVASYSGFLRTHPYQDEKDVQGNLELLYWLEQLLLTITGMDAVTLQPAAGAHGELTGMLLIRACHDARGEKRRSILIPDSAHGTNPASASLAGYDAIEIASDASGRVDLYRLKSLMSESVAGIMLTNPNTFGIFEKDILQIVHEVHQKGGLVYLDGANLNALLGVSRPGDWGVDILHLNVHKTFSTPHGGGGPGSGPVCVVDELEPFLPIPRIRRDGERYFLDSDRPRSIGRIRAFYGNFGVLLRCLAYILSLGGPGLRGVTEGAVVNANYVRTKLSKAFELAYPTPILHEVVFTDAAYRSSVETRDFAKRLIDYGFHPPTIYFPLTVSGAMMIEPTESVSRQELDRFIEACIAILREAREESDLVKTSPHTAPKKRLDEVRAAREPVLCWQEKGRDGVGGYQKRKE